jgi:hypothetical protein
VTFAEILAAMETAMKAVTALTGEVAAQRARIADLEAKVAAHDTQLRTAPDPGPKG